jgi:MFS superfamily sulfate permease-like transporter
MPEPGSTGTAAQRPAGAGSPAALSWPDLVAGLAVAGLLLPEAVAYAGLARLPVAHALVATLVGLAIYALLGASRFAIVAPTSSTATLTAAAVLAMPGTTAAVDPQAYLQAFMVLVLLAGALLMLLGWAGQGQLSSFVSRPVLRGFAFALALTIVIRQLPDVLGLVLPAQAGVDSLHVLLYALQSGPAWHAASIAVAAVAALLLALLRRWPRVPASLLVIVLAVLAAQLLDLASLGVLEVGAIERPAFRLVWPDLPLAAWLNSGELAVGLVVLVFAESWGSMRTLALAHGDALDADRELLVLGACNVGAALLQGLPVGAGYSASMANAAAGARSRWAGVVALAAIALALLLALPLLHGLARPVLAVAVTNALWHALSLRPLLAVWRMNRDRVLLIGAVAAVLLLGVLHGMLAAIALSLVAALRRFSQPVLHELGELGTTRNYVVIEHTPGAAALPGLLILRPEEPLFFASAERVAAEVYKRACVREGIKTVVLSLEESSDLDSTALECLLELHQRLHLAGRSLALARVKEPVRDLLSRCDPQGLGRPQRMFWSVADAAQARIVPEA